MNRLAKLLSLVLVVLAVPLTIMMVGIIVITVAFSASGIRGGWGLADIVAMVSGVMYPLLAVVAFRKVRSQTDSQTAVAWSFVPVPILVILVVLLVKFSVHVR